MSKLDPSILSANGACSWQIPGMGWAKAEGGVQVGAKKGPRPPNSDGTGGPQDARVAPGIGNAYDSTNAMASASETSQQGAFQLHLETRTQADLPRRPSSGRSREEPPSSPQPSRSSVKTWVAERQNAVGDGGAAYRERREGLKAAVSGRAPGPGENTEPNHLSAESPKRGNTSSGQDQATTSDGSARSNAQPEGSGEVEWLLSIRERLRRVQNVEARQELDRNRGKIQNSVSASPASSSVNRQPLQPMQGKNTTRATRSGDAWVSAQGGPWKAEEGVRVCDEDGAVVEGLHSDGLVIAGLQASDDEDAEGEGEGEGWQDAQGLSMDGGSGGGEDEQYGVSQAILDATLALAPGRRPLPVRCS